LKVIKAHDVDPTDLTAFERGLVYNGLDCMVTAEVLDTLLPQLDNLTGVTYAFSRELQAPCLEMRLRGVKIDTYRKDHVIEEYSLRLDQLERQLYRLAAEAVGFHGFNWRSTAHLRELFYDRLCVPVIRKQGRPTVNRDALEKMEAYTICQPFVKHLVSMSELGKRISMLKTEIDPDGRMRTSYNIGGTSTGRFSSSFSEFGTGTNLQNIEELLREIFIADDGMKMAYLDGEQGESRVVGGIEYVLFNDSRYLDACESGDLHTTVAKLVWPGLLWTGNIKLDKELAEQSYYRHYSRRFMCKKIGHGTNYGGKPRTLANQAKVGIALVEDFQPKYFEAFPAHHRWHAYVKKQLLDPGYLVSLTGRKRWFLGRRDADDTLREAIAFDPQGSLADIVNNGMLNVWRQHSCQLLMQVHDAIIVQYPAAAEDKIIPLVRKQLEYPIELKNGRKLVIPYGCKVGWNWGPETKENPHGLREWNGGDNRKPPQKTSYLDRR
jgi:DNA polymerase-1